VVLQLSPSDGGIWYDTETITVKSRILFQYRLHLTYSTIVVNNTTKLLVTYKGTLF